MDYKPEPGVALVKLIPRYSGVKAPSKTYDSIMEGEIISVNDDSKQHLVGRIGHWEQFKDSVQLDGGYAFIKLTDIYGSSDATNTTSNN